MAHSLWLCRLGNNKKPTLRIFCFSYAGGGVSTYRNWPALLPKNIEVVAIQLPGRESRFAEAPIDSLSGLLSKLTQEVPKLFDVPFVFFGHSLGALVAFEFTRTLRALRLPSPEKLFVSGRRAAHLSLDRKPFHQLSDDELIEEIKKFDDSNQELFDNRDLMKLMMPTLRADFTIHDTYQYTNAEPLQTPITVFGGLDDYTTDHESLTAWQKHSQQEINVSMLSGEHFFIDTAREVLLHRLTKELEKLTRQQELAFV
jgi:surfactin synthase thioesterase subunit